VGYVSRRYIKSPNDKDKLGMCSDVLGGEGSDG
jgi:hypothetical protein